MVTEEDIAFFDFLYPLRWPSASISEIELYRNLVMSCELQIETVYENTLALLSDGQYTRSAGVGQDFCDGSEAKKAVSQFRSISRNQQMNSIKFMGTKNKTGLVRASGYSKHAKSFFHFAFPHSAYSGLQNIEVILDRFQEGSSIPVGIPGGKWAKYMVGSIQELAKITEAEAELLPLKYYERLKEQLKLTGNINDDLINRLVADF